MPTSKKAKPRTTRPKPKKQHPRTLVAAERWVVWDGYSNKRAISGWNPSRGDDILGSAAIASPYKAGGEASWAVGLLCKRGKWLAKAYVKRQGVNDGMWTLLESLDLEALEKFKELENLG